MNLKNEIKKLVQLQKIDSCISVLLQEKDIAIPSQLNNLQDQFEKSKEKLLILEEKNKELLLKKKEKEIELASKEEGLKKAQGQLYQLKTNKEYHAKLTEIGSIKADISISEDEVIDALDKLELVKKETNSVNVELKNNEAILKAEEYKLKEKISNIEAELELLRGKKSLIAKDIDQEILTKYEDLIKTRQGLAIVPIENSNCGACYMSITPQTINEIKMYLKPVLCGNCVRILYIMDDIE